MRFLALPVVSVRAPVWAAALVLATSVSACGGASKASLPVTPRTSATSSGHVVVVPSLSPDPGVDRGQSSTPWPSLGGLPAASAVPTNAHVPSCTQGTNSLTAAELNVFRGSWSVSGQLTGQQYGVSQELALPKAIYSSWTDETATFALTSQDGPVLSFIVKSPLGSDGLPTVTQFTFTVPVDENGSRSYTLRPSRPMRFGVLSQRGRCDDVTADGRYELQLTKASPGHFHLGLKTTEHNDDPARIDAGAFAVTLVDDRRIELELSAHLPDDVSVSGEVTLRR